VKPFVIFCSSVMFISVSLPSFGHSVTDSLTSDPSGKNYDLALNKSRFTKNEVKSLADIHYKLLNTSPDSAFNLATGLVEISRNSGDDYSLFKSLIFLAGSKEEKGEIIGARTLRSEAKLIAGTDPKLKGDALFGLGRNFGKTDDYDVSISYFFEALSLFESVQDSISMFRCRYNIAGNYFNLSLFEKARENMNQAEQIGERLNNDQLRRAVYAGKGAMYSQLVSDYIEKKDTALVNIDLYTDSLTYFSGLAREAQWNSLELSTRLKENLNMLLAQIALASSYADIKDYDEALNRCEAADTLMAQLKADDLESQLNYQKSRIYLALDEPEKALTYGLKALQSAKKSNRDRRIYRAHLILCKVNSALKNHEVALYHLKQYDDYLAKLNDSQRTKILAEADAKFNSVKNEKKILELEVDNQKIQSQRNSILGILGILTITGFSMFQMFRFRKEKNDKKAFAEALINAQEEERKRIARDLHDGVGQSLLFMKKQMVSQHEVTVENQQLISHTLEEVRAISRDLHPFQLEMFGLKSALQSVILNVEKSSDIFVSNHLINEVDDLPSRSKIQVFRAVQEAFNNIMKHSKASAAKLSISDLGPYLEITIQDNGIGFDYDVIKSTANSLGLRTIKERMDSIKGKLTIQNNEPSGTILSFKIPKKF
jgi:signal transduction histidine kinase